MTCSLVLISRLCPERKYALIHLACLHTKSDYQFNTVNKPLTQQLNDSAAGQIFPGVHSSAEWLLLVLYPAFPELSDFALSEVLEGLVSVLKHNMLKIFMNCLNQLSYSLRNVP